MQKGKSTPPVARIIQRDGKTLGEVTGTPGEIKRIKNHMEDCAEALACRFDTDTVESDDTNILHLRITAVPQKHHQIKAETGKPPVNPARALLLALFRDDRQPFPRAYMDIDLIGA